MTKRIVWLPSYWSVHVMSCDGKIDFRWNISYLVHCHAYVLTCRNHNFKMILFYMEDIDIHKPHTQNVAVTFVLASTLIKQFWFWIKTLILLFLVLVKSFSCLLFECWDWRQHQGKRNRVAIRRQKVLNPPRFILTNYQQEFLRLTYGYL